MVFIKQTKKLADAFEEQTFLKVTLLVISNRQTNKQ